MVNSTRTNAPGRGADGADVADQIIDLLAPLLAQHRRRWAERAQARGLSIIGFQVLALLEINGAMPMGRLAEALDVALPNATGIVNRLADRGIVTRDHDELDRRVVRVALSDAGRELVAEMEAERRARIHRLIGALDAGQRERLLASMRDLRAALDALNPTERTR